MTDLIRKPLAWLSGEVKTPPFSSGARIEAGFYLRKIQNGESLPMPVSRPMPSIGANCHELRIVDSEVDKTWRTVYCIDEDAILILEVFPKKTAQTPQQVIKNCQRRLKQYYS
ncbi:type II toxin-antitoxin system RelE/ParE family toxin [Chroococcidiopsis sp. CCMEE 29]|uniref:type II toxin-antitoxin system RelE/ParE family toxin n=1 Tax=Chroococcidiopsis sp. CCMEE 29 TaxID=155894 RepID=UPI0020201C5F|nr:type II toxin-antitoxin system RelE/ParE family toxin [Chroococcidiopsis sp. CCMEE 29]